MTEEQIKQFPKSAEEYFYKQSKDGTPWKSEVHQFFEVINFYRKTTKGLQEELNYAETHCLFHGDCPIQEENVVAKEQVEKMKKCLRELIESMQPIKFEEDRQRAIVKAEAFLKE